MTQSDCYHIRMILRLTHDYYEVVAPPVKLVPDRSTSLVMQQESILLKKEKPDRWLLLQEDRPGIMHGSVRLVFEMHITSSLFYYVTAGEQEEKGYSYHSVSIPGVWRTVAVDTLDQQEVHIHLQGKSKFMEFLCIPKYTTSSHPLRMAERSGAIRFSEPEALQLFGHIPAFRFVTTQPVLLRQRQKLRVSLWEVRDKAEKLLTRDLPLPDAENLSPIHPEDTITTYFYF